MSEKSSDQKVSKTEKWKKKKKNPNTLIFINLENLLAIKWLVPANCTPALRTEPTGNHYLSCKVQLSHICSNGRLLLPHLKTVTLTKTNFGNRKLQGPDLTW